MDSTKVDTKKKSKISKSKKDEVLKDTNIDYKNNTSDNIGYKHNISSININDINSDLIQPCLNIGLVGHVDHGKTTIAKALSGVWTSKYSDEIERGITIKLGYADFSIYKCPKCSSPQNYGLNKKCKYCGSETKFINKLSIVDVPGHEALMSVMLSGAAIMDIAILVIAANEKFPQPQTTEHITALKVLGITNIIVAQNKIDLVSREDAVKQYNEIKNFIKESFPNASIIPISASYGVNIDALIKTIAHKINDKINWQNQDKKELFMYVVRSFDINKPGTDIKDLKGGVIGGSIVSGTLKVGDEIEIRPGIKRKNKYVSLITKVVDLRAGNVKLQEAKSGGLISIGTTLDPVLTKADAMVGNVVGHVGKLPNPVSEINVETHLFEKLTTTGEIKPLIKGEKLMLSIGTALRLGIVKNIKKGVAQFELSSFVCVEKGQKVAIGRKFKALWRLIGYGIVK